MSRHVVTLPRRFARQMNREHALVQALMARVGTPHAWGTADCWSLVVQTVAILVDRPESVLRQGLPVYSTLTGAINASAASGGIARVLRTWGLMELPHAHPCLGDIAVCRTAAPFEAAAIAMGGGRFLGATEGRAIGWIILPTPPVLFRVH